MFKNPFTTDGRIRRTEYGLSLILGFFGFFILAVIISLIGEAVDANKDNLDPFFTIIYIPYLWFSIAQGAKRCHDLGKSGWMQLVPFYGLWMLFEEGKPGPNKYGENPKGIQLVNGQPQQIIKNPTNTGSGYQGGYSGGHNNPSTNYTNDSQSSREGYTDGDLYK